MENALAKRSEVASVISREIERLLDAMDIGDVLAWETLESTTGRAREALYGLCGSARRRLERDASKHFRTVEGVGVERISDSEAVNWALPKYRRSIGGKSRRMVRTTRAVDRSKVTKEESLQADLTCAVGQLVASTVSAKGMRRLTSGETMAPLSAKDLAAKLLTKDVVK